MEILVLKRYSSGYRGCVIDSRYYSFFQFSAKKGLKILHRYPQSDFENIEHFVGVMAKFLSLSAFILPPITIADINAGELERVAKIREKSRL